MKNKNIILTLSVAAVITASVIVSCTKDITTTQNSNAALPAVATKTAATDTALTNAMNEFYRLCVRSFQADSADYFDACANDSLEEFLHHVGISDSLVNLIMYLSNPDTTFNSQPSIKEPIRGTDTGDFCVPCMSPKVGVLASNMVEIFHITKAIDELDRTFDEDNPIMATTAQGCLHNCRIWWLGNPSMIQLCTLMCYADYNIRSLGAILYALMMPQNGD